MSVGEVDVELGLEFEVDGLGAAELSEDAGEFWVAPRNLCKGSRLAVWVMRGTVLGPA